MSDFDFDAAILESMKESMSDFDAAAILKSGERIEKFGHYPKSRWHFAGLTAQCIPIDSIICWCLQSAKQWELPSRMRCAFRVWLSKQRRNVVGWCVSTVPRGMCGFSTSAWISAKSHVKIRGCLRWEYVQRSIDRTGRQTSSPRHLCASIPWCK